MKTPEKITERLPQTIVRTVITTTVIALIMTFAHVFSGHKISVPNLFASIWLLVFCIVFFGHWLERLFINHLKFMLPLNLPILYVIRIVYWFLCALPLFWLGNKACTIITGQVLFLGHWWMRGILYIGIEMFMHAIMQLRWKKSFYNGVY